MVTCNGQWCVRLPYGAMLRNTIDSFMAIIRHFEVARETRGDGCQRALWVILREAFSTWRQIRPPKQCTLTTISPGLPRNLNVANYVHKAIPQCNLTPRKNNRSGVTLKGFPEPERVL